MRVGCEALLPFTHEYAYQDVLSKNVHSTRQILSRLALLPLMLAGHACAVEYPRLTVPFPDSATVKQHWRTRFLRSRESF